MHTHHSHPRGAALMLALSLTVVALVVVIGVMRAVIPFMLQSAHFASATMTYYAAESGVELALYERSLHAQGYESMGPNRGTIPVAEVGSEEWFALFPHVVARGSAHTDDINFRTPATCTTSEDIALTSSTRSCADYNNDPYTYNFSTCCAGTNLNQYRFYCEDAVRKLGLDTVVGNQCFADRIAIDAGRATVYSNTCIETLSRSTPQGPAPQTCSTVDQEFPGVSAIGGYSITSLTSVIPRPGRGSSPSTIGANRATPYDWNTITPDTPIVLHLAYEQNGSFGDRFTENSITTPFTGEKCQQWPSNTSQNLLFYARLPLLAPQAQLNTLNTYQVNPNEPILRWQVSGYAKNPTTNAVNRNQSYTLFSISPELIASNTSLSTQPITDITASKINEVTTQTLGTNPNSDPSAILTLSHRGVPDIAFAQSYYGNQCTGNAPTTMTIGQFIQLVHDPVLRITMVSNPHIGNNTLLTPPYLEYQVRLQGGVVLPDTVSLIQGVGQTVRTQARQFTQTIETKVPTDMAAPILDFIIFQ